MAAVVFAAIIPFCAWDKPSDVDYEDEVTMFGTGEGHWSDLAGSDFMFLLSSVSCFLFIVKTSSQDWGLMYLVQERGLSNNMASSHLIAMEVGGLVGSIVLGALTDLMIRKKYYFGTGKSPRMSIVQLCVAGACLSLNLFMFTIDIETSKAYMWVLGFVMGFCMYGALSLLGTIAVEVAPIQMTGSAQGFVGLAGNIGVIIAGAPMNYIASAWDWFGVFMLSNILGLVAFLILVIGKDIHASYKQAASGVKRLSTGK
ncbi:SLC37A4 [Bugula neritina]|uniref:SLC37A4 n=1 Tax=Bugula neritina TaxID=10212 RepID=A0A7J7IYU4_BUGNE|nr:SLC37A4 [Bugula neritina]